MSANIHGESPEPEAARDAVAERVRRRLRELRVAQGLTLEQVAERASMATSTLSRLESGQRRLTLDHLPGLAAALGVSTDALLGPAPARDPRVRSKPIRRHQLTMWPLSANPSAAGLQAYKVRVSARRNQPPAELPVHEGRDWIYVLAGRMRLMLGEDDLVIEAGEAVEFSTWTPHWFGAIDGPVDLLMILGPQGERVHVHS
jgi:transcriptional regulator with XRE-family HTH domain